MYLLSRRFVRLSSVEQEDVRPLAERLYYQFRSVTVYGEAPKIEAGIARCDQTQFV
jgi:hypothetical protein